MKEIYKGILAALLPLTFISCSPSVTQVVYPIPATPLPIIEKADESRSNSETPEIPEPTQNALPIEETIDTPSDQSTFETQTPVPSTPSPVPTPTPTLAPKPDEPSVEKVEPAAPKPSATPAQKPKSNDQSTNLPKKDDPANDNSVSDSGETFELPEVDTEGLVIPEEFLSLSYYDADKHDRYLIYKALNPEYDYDKVILYVNIGLDKPFYADIKKIDQPNRLDVLVNKYNKLPDNYKPQLVEIPKELLAPGVGRQYLRKETKEAFEKMHADAKLLGLNITVYGTYRSIQTQHDIWNRKVKSGRSIEDVDSLNARGGHSEHHTGLAVDVIKNDYTTDKTKEYEWYKENAHHYGFIIRYPKGKESITGYAYEPWHLRYLGTELATAVYESGLTYEEYYAQYIEPSVNIK